jgi:hypothetical protein
VLAAAAVEIWVILGMMPGRIARERNHPQAEAIRIKGAESHDLYSSVPC